MVKPVDLALPDHLVARIDALPRLPDGKFDLSDPEVLKEHDALVAAARQHLLPQVIAAFDAASTAH